MKKYFKKSEWTYNNYFLMANIVGKRICFKSYFHCPNLSEPHTLIVWNVTVTLWTFTLWAAYLWTFTPSHYSSICRQVATVFNDTGNAFNIQAVSVWIKGAATFILLLLANGYIHHGHKPLQGRHYATSQRKCALCPKFDSQCQRNIRKKLHVRYVGCGGVFIE